MSGKNCFLVVLLSALFSLLPNTFSEACGPLEPEFEGYSFIRNDIVEDTSSFSPYFLRFEEVYDYYKNARSQQIRGNLDEWKSIFCEQPKLQDLYQVIYKTPKGQLELLRTAVRSKNMPLPFKLSKNTFALYLKRNKCSETVDYLIYAKTCEDYVIPESNVWKDDPERKEMEMKRLIRQGLKTFSKTKSQYLRLRYAFQMIRLAHYSKDYEQTLDLTNRLLPRIDYGESLIRYWILGHEAGAMKSTGQKLEAAYRYLQIFKNCPSKREQAYRSFYVASDEDWYQLLLMCKDDEERAMLYALRARNESIRTAEEMNNIYELDPRNEYLELLLVREIKKLEKDFLGLAFNDRRHYNERFHQLPRKDAGKRLIPLQTFARRCAKERKVERPELWKIAEGYLAFLANDLYEAERTLAEAEREVVNDTLKDQLAAMQLALKVQLYEVMDYDNEEEIYAIMKDNPLYKAYPSFPDFINDRIGQLYSQEGHPGLSFRAHYTLASLKLNPQIDIIEDLISICRKPEKSALEEAMIIDSNQVNILNDLLEMKGNLLFHRGQLEAAVEVFKEIPYQNREKYPNNPFYPLLHDCRHCKVEHVDGDSLPTYNKIEFIQRIFELEYQAKANFDRGPYYLYSLGNAYYNLSYFGHSWSFFDQVRGGSNWRYDKDQVYPFWSWEAPYGNREYTDMSKALFYYDKVIDLSKDAELAAKAAFMAAKCQLNNYYISKDCDYYPYSGNMPNPPAKYRTYFELLKNDYNGTDFYQEIIEECLYFRAYALK
ncbi:MAG: hypothetical protein AAFP19_09450 [Bacteroidota bacterium]